jgi:hypothetical protein
LNWLAKPVNIAEAKYGLAGKPGIVDAVAQIAAKVWMASKSWPPPACVQVKS